MIKIDKLTKEDIPQVVLLEEQFLGETLGSEMLENELENEFMCFLSAKDNKKVLGYIGAYVINGELEILNFVVDGLHQRTGIGTLLFNELLNRYPDAKTIVLEVREQNEKGINFYKKNNFNVISKRKHYYKNGDDALVMMKEIK
jgi:ribosomal-protein-alanine N-acetyltransferase